MIGRLRKILMTPPSWLARSSTLKPSPRPFALRRNVDSAMGKKNELESQWFAKIDDDDPLASTRDDSYLLLRLTQFF